MPSKHPEICLSLMPRKFDQLPGSFRKGTAVDLFEIRLDYLIDVDFAALRKMTSKPLIVTRRAQAESGSSQSSFNQQIEMFRNALKYGVDYLDVEWQQSARILPELPRESHQQIILSHHTETREYTALVKTLEQMLQIPAGIYKLIFTAEELNDNFTALRLIRFARKKGVSFVIHAMSEAGIPSRLIGALRGNRWTYAALDAGHRTAPGQLTLSEINREYFLKEKTAQTRIIGLSGYPVQQSVGYKLHNRLLHLLRKEAAASRQSVQDFLYLNFPAPDFDSFWQQWSKVIDGLSVTLPHKSKITGRLSGVDAYTRRSGVCNTAVKQNGNWQGFNTDVLAITELLRPFAGQLHRGVLIIGSGATARSALTALQQIEVERIFIGARNASAGETLSCQFGCRFVPLPEVASLEVSGVVQTTPVGMFPDTDALAPGTEVLRPGMVVLDVVYNPPVTRFLQEAKTRGCLILSGEEMFLLQAAKQFEIFSGVKVDLNRVRQVWREVGVGIKV